ncbi:MAG: hypothetical protein AB1744_13785 [Candidatus Zixiibacteriota bacterium]
MKKNMTILLSVSAITLFAVQVGHAADTSRTAPADPATGEEINWQVISSGGTNATSGNLWLRGTVGQTAVGISSSGGFNLSHGFWYPTCCNGDGMRGNVDGVVGPGGAIDVADLTYLVAYLFQGGSAPPCIEEGNVDGVIGPGGPIDVADLTYLVAYLFQGGASPAPCP